MRSAFIVASIAAVSAAVETETLQYTAAKPSYSTTPKASYNSNNGNPYYNLGHEESPWDQCKADIKDLQEQVAALQGKNTT